MLFDCAEVFIGELTWYALDAVFLDFDQRMGAVGLIRFEAAASRKSVLELLSKQGVVSP